MGEWSLAIGVFHFTVVDIIIFALLFMGAVLGAVKGFAREASTRFGFIIAILVAMLFTQSGSSLISSTFSLPPLWSSLITFLLLFIIAYSLMLLLGTVLEKTLETIKLGWLDSILGLLLGIIEMFIAITFVIYVFQMQPIIDISKFMNSSELYQRVINPLVPKILTYFNQALQSSEVLQNV
jgi:membrane protein required for colicin V production